MTLLHRPDGRSTRRSLGTTLAAATVAALVAAPAGAATTAGPDRFEGEATSEVLRLSLSGPAELFGELGDAEEGLVLQVGGARALLGSDVTPVAEATLLPEPFPGGRTEGDGSFDETQLDQEEGPVRVTGGVMRGTVDEQGGVATATSSIASLVVDLTGVLDELPAEASEPIRDGLSQLDEEVAGLVGQLNDALGQVEDAVADATGELPADLPEVEVADVAPPTLSEVPLLEVGLATSTSTVETVDGVVTATGTSTLDGVRLLGGTITIPSATFTSTASTDGTPGGASADTQVESIAVVLAETLVEIDGGVLRVGDVTLDLDELLVGGVGDADEVLQPVLDVLTQLLEAGGFSVVQGEGTTDVADDGSLAAAASQAFAIRLRPLQAVDEDLLDLNLQLLTTGVAVAGAVDAPVTPSAPAPAPTPEMPRTGGGASAVLLSSVALGGAWLLRRRGGA